MRIWTATKLIVLGLLLLVAGVLLRTVCIVVAPENVRQALLAEFARSVDAELAIERAELDFAGALHVWGISISPPGTQEPLLTVDRMRVDIDIGRLLSGEVVPEQVTLVRPAIRLVRDDDSGAWNFDKLGLKNGEGDGAGAAPALDLLRRGVTLQDAALSVVMPEVFGNQQARRFEHLHLRATPEAGTWRLEGECTGGMLRGTRLSGWLRPGGPPQMDLRIANSAMQVGEALWPYVPSGNKLWRDFRLSGLASVDAHVASSEEGKLSWAVVINALDCSATVKHYPLPVESAGGNIIIDDSGITLRGVKGIVRADAFGDESGEAVHAHVAVDGTYLWNSGPVALKISADDVPICEQTVAGVPEVGPALWERLNPSGMCRLDVMVRRRDGSKQLTYEALADIRSATLRPKELPLPLQQVAGTLAVDPRAVELQNVHGVIVQPGEKNGASSAAHVSANGRLSLTQSTGELAVSVRNLRTSESLILAIPEYGERVWQSVRPRALINADVVLESAGGGSLVPSSVQVQVLDGSSQLDFMPVVIHGLSGNLHLEGTELLFDDVGGIVRVRDEWREEPPTESPLRVNGRVDLADGNASVHLDGHEVVLTERLLRSVPGIGDRLWEQFRPAGVASFGGQVLYDSSHPQPFRCFLNVDLLDIALEPAAVPLPISAVSGTVLATGERMFSNELSGIVCGGRVLAQAVAHFRPATDFPSYAASVEFHDVDLERLAGQLSEAQQSTGKLPAGLISGTVDVGGIMGQARSFTARGQVELQQGQLLDAPFFGRLLGVLRLQIPGGKRSGQKGRLVFDIDRQELQVKEFELTGGGLNISGYGTIGFDTSLKLTLVAFGAPEEGRGIPILSSLVDWVLRGIESQLVRVDVTGTWNDPQFSSQVLSTITWPIRSLRTVLFSPILGDGRPEGPTQVAP